MRPVTWRLRAILPLIFFPSVLLFILVHVSHDELISTQDLMRSRQLKRRVLETGSKVARDSSSNEDSHVQSETAIEPFKHENHEERPFNGDFGRDKQIYDEPLPFQIVRTPSPVNFTTSGNPKSLLVAPRVTAVSGVCDVECSRLQAVFASWPPNKPKAAIYILTQSQRWDYLQRVLTSVDQYFNNHHKYPVIIFHEEEFLKRRDDVIRLTNSDVYFQTVSFSVPDFFDKSVPVNIPCTSAISYRHMCRFHAKTVYEMPIMRELEYYWRLDDDSLLLANISYDVFQFMYTKNYQYGYIWRHLDAYSCVQGLWESTTKYIDAKNITTYSFSTWKRPWLYYNNFEISAMHTWTSVAYKDYIEYIDRLGGIYYHRWGDAPIRGIAVSMFIPKSQVHLFDDIAYQHRTYIHEPKT